MSLYVSKLLAREAFLISIIFGLLGTQSSHAETVIVDTPAAQTNKKAILKSLILGNGPITNEKGVSWQIVSPASKATSPDEPISTGYSNPKDTLIDNGVLPEPGDEFYEPRTDSNNTSLPTSNKARKVQPPAETDNALNIPDVRKSHVVEATALKDDGFFCEEAYKAYRRQNYTAAQEMIEQDINIGLQSGYCYRLLAFTYAKQKNYAASLEAAKKSIQWEPNDPNGHELVANALFLLKKSIEARPYYLHSFDLGNRELRFFNNTLIALNSLGDWHGMLDFYEKIQPEFPRELIGKESSEMADIFFNVSLAYLGLNDKEQELLSLNKAIAFSSSYSGYYVNRANNRMTRGDFGNALFDLNQAISRNPKDGAAYLNRAIANTQLKRYAQAEQDMHQAQINGMNDLDVGIQLGLIYTGLKRLPEAKAVLEKTLANYPNDIRVRNNLASIYRELKFFALAERLFKNDTAPSSLVDERTTKESNQVHQPVLELQASNPNPELVIRYNQAMNLMEQQRWAQAKLILSSLVFDFPDFSQGWQQLGRAATELKQWDEAYTIWSSALQIFPNEWKLYANRGQLSEQMNSLDKAELDLQQAITLAPKQATLQQYLGRVYAKNGEPQKANLHYQKALSAGLNSHSFFAEYSQFLLNQESHRGAENVLKSALKHYPGSRVLGLHLAHLYANTQRKHEALKILRSLFVREPHNADINNNLGNLYFEHLKQPLKAIPFFLTAIEADSPSAKSYANLVQAYMATHQWEKAESVANQGVNRFPTLSDSFLIRSKVMQRTNQKQAFLNDSQKALEILQENSKQVSEAHPDVENMRSQANILQSLERCSEALPLYRRYMTLRDSDADTHSNFGFCLFETGDINIAQSYFENALQLDGKHLDATIGMYALSHLFSDRVSLQRYKAMLNKLAKLPVNQDLLNKLEQQDYFYSTNFKAIWHKFFR